MHYAPSTKADISDGIDLNPLLEQGKRVVVVVASDGVFDSGEVEQKPNFGKVFAENVESHLKRLVAEGKQGQLQDMQRCVGEALEQRPRNHPRWDDLTIVSKEITPEFNQNLMMTVADGNGLRRALNHDPKCDKEPLSPDVIQALATYMRHPQLATAKIAQWSRKPTGEN